MLNIGQFLNEGADVDQCTPWLLAHAQALQHVGEAMEGKRWQQIGICFDPEVSPLIDAFIAQTEVELMEIGITTCWSEASAAAILPQKQDGPLADVIAFLDELAMCMPSHMAWDELVYPLSLTETSPPHRSQHLGYILGHKVDLGSTFPSFWFCVTEAGI